MSTKVLIKLELMDDFIDLNKQIKISFDILSKALACGIALNFNSNIDSKFYELLKNIKKNEIMIELLDSPISIESDVLFLGDKVSYVFYGEKIDTSESLLSRMLRVQHFCELIFQTNKIKNIVMDIDALNTFDYQDFEKIEIKLSDFADKMVDLFAQHNQMTPTIRVYFVEK